MGWQYIGWRYVGWQVEPSGRRQVRVSGWDTFSQTTAEASRARTPCPMLWKATRRLTAGRFTGASFTRKEQNSLSTTRTTVVGAKPPRGFQLGRLLKIILPSATLPETLSASRSSDETASFRPSTAVIRCVHTGNDEEATPKGQVKRVWTCAVPAGPPSGAGDVGNEGVTARGP